MRHLKVSLAYIGTCLLLLSAGLSENAHAQAVQRFVVMRVDFQDSGTTQPRYTRQEIEQLLDKVSDLFTMNSNGAVKVKFDVTDIFRLPKNKAAYTNNMETALQDALNSAPPAVRALWGNDVHAIVVLLSQTWSAGGSYYKTRNVGVGGNALWVGNAVVGENPNDSDRQVWGRWAHEVGHNLQVGYAAGAPVGGHPSGYQSDFDLMDMNYPGRIGAVSIQSDNQFRTLLPSGAYEPWLYPEKYQTFTRAKGGGSAAIWAVEYDHNARPNVQAVKVEISPPHVYYMVSVRRRVRGDDLNDSRTPAGIPDEGVLIERVDHLANPQAISTVIGRNKGPVCSTPPNDCNRRQLWKAGDTFRAPGEVTIEVTKKVDDDNYLIRVIYDDAGVQQADVMINPWLAPPGNTWETTDIWVDSPVNGFGVFRYGEWDDGSGNSVPTGNGDDPAVGLTNRVYARIRNVGRAPASDVVTTIEVTDPLGLGISSATSWVTIGRVDKTTFPALASIAAGGFVDVYVDWNPTAALTRAQLAAGEFYFHSCLRVRIDGVPGETVLANQDGDREQENISYFQAPPTAPKALHHWKSVWLNNDDLKHPKDVILGYRLTEPNQGVRDWAVQLNNGVDAVTLAPGERREIPVEIIQSPSAKRPGQHYSLDVFGLTRHVLVNKLDNKDVHNEFRYTGGARIEALVVAPSDLKCKATMTSKGLISVAGRIGFPETVEKLGRDLPIMAVGWNSKSGFIESSRVLMTPGRKGQFRGSIKANKEPAIESVDCLFSGTTEVSSAWQRVPVARGK